MKANPDWLAEHERVVAVLSLPRAEMAERDYVAALQALDPSGDLYAGYVDGLTPRDMNKGHQAVLV